MKLLQNIQSTTPRWAAKAMISMTVGYTTIVALQEMNIIDILPMDQGTRDAIKVWVTVLVSIGGLFFANQKKGGVKPLN